MAECDLEPSYDCLEDADALEWLLLHQRPWKIFTFSPVQAERQHCRSVFENLVAKRSGCHEALFGLGRLLVLDCQFEEGLRCLEEACALRPDGLYLAWMGWALLLCAASQNFLQRPRTQQRARRCCEDALKASEDLPLALRCLANLGDRTAAARAAEVDVFSVTAFAKHLLEGGKPERRAATEALRKVLAEVSLDEEALSSAGAVVRSLDQEPDDKSSAKEGVVHRAISSKVLALEILWSHLRHRNKRPARAAEAALLAAVALRPFPIPWQRAVCLALKALALDGQWDECWRLAAAELSYRSSREILYQCGRLAHYDGREEACQAYLPHLRGMLPLVPASVQPAVGFWVALLQFSGGYPLPAAKALQEVWPAVQDSRHQSTTKQRLAKDVLNKVADLEANVRRIYDASNAVWLQASGKAQKELAAEAEQGPSAQTKGKGKSQSADQLVHRRPPGYCDGPARPGKQMVLGDAEADTVGFGSAEATYPPPLGSALPGNWEDSPPWRAEGASARPAKPASWSVALGPALRQAASASPWSLFSSWRASQAIAAVEAEDAFLGKLCQGRLHLMRGELEEAERVWAALSSESNRLEVFIELWSLHDAQLAHKKAVLSARRALDLCGDTERELQVSLDPEVLLHKKVWGGSSGEALECRTVVQLLLAKSLRRCGLYEDAWQLLLAASREAVAWNAEEASTQGAYGAFLYQGLK
eukprot:s3280_g3.t1